MPITKQSLLILLLAPLLLTLGACETLTTADNNDKTQEEGFTALFDGKTLDGWEGDTTWFHVKDGAIAAGSSEKPVTDTVFLATKKSYYNFELRYELRINGPRETSNGGVQFRTVRKPNSPGVSGYQVDAGQVYWGRIYDEGRRNQLLTEHPEGFSIDEDVNLDGWNTYRVIAKDGHIQVWLNDIKVGDYHEADEEIAKQTGIIAVQAHRGPPSEIWYRNLRIKELD